MAVFRKIFVLVLATILTMFRPAFADGYYTGATLRNYCADRIDMNTQQALDYSLCTGFLTAIASASRCGNKVHGFSALVPDNAKATQLSRIVVKWLNDHPEKLHVEGSYLVANAFQDAFPCP